MSKIFNIFLFNISYIYIYQIDLSLFQTNEFISKRQKTHQPVNINFNL